MKRSSLRDRLKLATSEAILSATEETLVERGLDATGIAEIAARAGVAVGTLYNHFQDREALLGALMADRGRELLERLDESLATPGDFRARLGALTRAFFQHVELHYGLLRVMLDNTCPSATHVRERQKNMHQQIRERVDRLMKQGSREGSLRRDPAGLHTVILLGMIKGVLTESQEGATPPRSTEVLADTVTRIFVEGAGR